MTASPTGEKPFIPCILGTARNERRSENVAAFLFDMIQQDDRFESEYIDIRDMLDVPRTVPPWESDAAGGRWRSIADRADGFILVSPEYNHGYPGELKLLWDMAFDEYEGKPIAIVSVSKGGFGGVRMVENFLHVVQACHMTLVPKTVNVSKVKTFDAEKDTYKDRFQTMIDALISYITH